MKRGTEYVVVAGFDREAAEALLAEAQPESEAARRGTFALRDALAGTAEAELVIVGQGVAALDSLMSHDPDMIVIDESDGVGLIHADEYRDLFGLLQLLRDNKVEVERSALVDRIHKALDRGLKAFVEDDDAGIDAQHDFYAAAIADELLPATLVDRQP